MSNSEDLVAVLLPDDDSCTVWTVHYMTKEAAEKTLEATINDGSSLRVSEKVLNANTDVIQKLQVDTSGYLKNEEVIVSSGKSFCLGISIILALAFVMAIMTRVLFG